MTMSFTYHVDHEVIVRGISTIHSDEELTVEQLKELFPECTGCDSPGTFVANGDPMYPVLYGAIQGVTGSTTLTHEDIYCPNQGLSRLSAAIPPRVQIGHCSLT